jgi:hypothetical protein
MYYVWFQSHPTEALTRVGTRYIELTARKPRLVVRTK